MTVTSYIGRSIQVEPSTLGIMELVLEMTQFLGQLPMFQHQLLVQGRPSVDGHLWKISCQQNN